MALSQEKGSPFVDYQDDVDLGFSGDVDGGGGGSSSNSVARTRQDYADDSDVIVVDADNNVIWIKEDHNEQPQDYDEPTSTIDPGVLAKLDLELAMQIDAAQRQTAARRGTRRQDMGKVGRFFLDTSDLWRDRYSLRSSERRTYGQWTIWLLSFVQSCIFIAELAVGGFAPPQENWMLGPNAGTLILFGGNVPFYLRTDFWPNVYRIFVPIFLHAGVLHIASNVVFQLIFGYGLNRSWGHARLLAIYLVSGVGANLCTALFMSQGYVVSVGASGALLGLMGGVVGDLCLNWEYMVHPKKQVVYWAVFIVPMFIFGLIPDFVDNMNHIGGFWTGFWASLAFLKAIKPQYDFRMICLRVAGVFMTVLSISLGIGLLNAGIYNTSPIMCYIFIETRC